jgi:hypothetical protein
MRCHVVCAHPLSKISGWRTSGHCARNSCSRAATVCVSECWRAAAAATPPLRAVCGESNPRRVRAGGGRGAPAASRRPWPGPPLARGRAACSSRATSESRAGSSAGKERTSSRGRHSEALSEREGLGECLRAEVALRQEEEHDLRAVNVILQRPDVLQIVHIEEDLDAGDQELKLILDDRDGVLAGGPIRGVAGRSGGFSYAASPSDHRTDQMCERKRCHVRPSTRASSGGCLVETRRIVGTLARRRMAMMVPTRKIRSAAAARTSIQFTSPFSDLKPRTAEADCPGSSPGNRNSMLRKMVVQLAPRKRRRRTRLVACSASRVRWAQSDCSGKGVCGVGDGLATAIQACAESCSTSKRKGRVGLGEGRTTARMLSSNRL